MIQRIAPDSPGDRESPEAGSSWEEDHRARLLYAFGALIGTIGALFLGIQLLTLFLPRVVDPPLLDLLLDGLALGVGGVTIWLVRSGRSQAASWLILTCFLIVATAHLYTGGDPPTNVTAGLGLLITVVLAVVFLEEDRAWLMFAVAAAVYVGINILWLGNLLPPPIYRGSPSMAGFVMLAWTVCTGIIVLVVHSTMAGLRDRAEALTRRVAEHRQALEALRNEQVFSESILNAVVDTVFVFDPTTGKPLRWNRAFERVSGFTGQEIAARRAPDDWYDERDLAQAAEATTRLLDGQGEQMTLEMSLIRKDGTRVPTEYLASLVNEEDGQPWYVIAVGRDITERKMVEEELRRHRDHLEDLVAERTASLNERLTEIKQLNRAMADLLDYVQAANASLEQTSQQLQETNRELESFAYSVSHDLRAPLRAIDGFSRILIEEQSHELSPQAHHYLDMVRDNAQQMGQLIDDLLAFSRLSRRPLRKRPVQLKDLVKRVLQDFHQHLEDRNVDFSVGDLPTCQADPALLRQVLINLIANALKFTRNQDVARIEIGYLPTQDGDNVYFVRDNGVGFDMRYADKLFGVFQRLHRAEEYEGTGVGLAIVQRIIHRHGGRIWAEAEVDQGATLYFTL